MNNTTKTIVIGHKNPDVDSISAAYAYAGLKRSLGVPNVIAASYGMPNRSARYLFNRFEVALPKSMRAVYPRVEDIYSKECITVCENSSALAALSKMNEVRHRRIPVVGDDDEYKGMISMFDMFEGIFGNEESASSFGRKVDTSVEQIVKILSGTNVTGIGTAEINTFYVYVGAMSAENLNKRLADVDCSTVVMVVGDRKNIQELSIELNISVLVVTGGAIVDEELLEEAKKRGISVIYTVYDSATTIRRIKFSSPIFLETNRSMTSYRCTDRIVDISTSVKKDPTDLFPVVNKNNKLIGNFLKSDLDSDQSINLVLVDHNELEQAIDGASEVPIIEILDHHRIGITPTDKPLRVFNDIVGSSCTLVYEQYKINKINLNKKTAGVLLGGVISDTVHLKSPTTTQRDIAAVKELSKITGCDPKELYSELLQAGSIIATQPPETILNTDRKNYHEHGVSFSVCQVEEGSFVSFLNRKDDIQAEINNIVDRDKLNFFGLLVTNVVSGNSLLLVGGDEKLIEELPYMVKGEKTLFDLPGILSRKKQLLPELLDLFKGIS
ncbi:MAG: putative manganese-dependent inorganic diphosphatase [Kiritimatiellae bacterium]|jgi:manganese-dependent inorganic pyrophosphatase|nr:putative manganese-dependent inorganic diphosphatase [Kiritimatiellia bacterium]